MEHKSSKHHDKSHEKQRLDKEARKKLREERHEEKRIEKNRQRREDLSLHSNDQPVLEDLSADDDDDDKFNGMLKHKFISTLFIWLLFSIIINNK